MGSGMGVRGRELGMGVWGGGRGRSRRPMYWHVFSNRHRAARLESSKGPGIVHYLHGEGAWGLLLGDRMN